MKIGYLIAVLLICSNLFAQTVFEKQFRDIINDTANGFPHFRGTVRVETKSDLKEYASLITLANTSKNHIKYAGNGMFATYAYSALIADSANENDGINICDQFRNEIVSIIGNSYVIKKYQANESEPAKYGWLISKDELEISIDFYLLGDKELHSVWLHIYYTFQIDK